MAAWFGGKKRYYEGSISDHFDGKRFFNPGSPMRHKFTDRLRWKFRESNTSWPLWVEGQQVVPAERVEGPELTVTYVGHATFLMQLCGLNILLDPVWAERASPLSFAGPRRVNAPGIAFEDLPPIDVVFISHNHYDHMDAVSVAWLRQVHDPKFIVPLGNGALLQRFDPAINTVELDWEQELALNDDVRLHMQQSHHWSSRSMHDKQEALWGAFVLETPNGPVYFAGDTGFGGGKHFRRVRERFGPMWFAFLPIGAYAPRWFMEYSHMNPEEAVEAFQILEADSAFAYHWGTFKLTNEPIFEPVERLEAALAAQEIDPTRFAAQLPGCSFKLEKD